MKTKHINMDKKEIECNPKFVSSGRDIKVGDLVAVVDEHEGLSSGTFVATARIGRVKEYGWRPYCVDAAQYNVILQPHIKLEHQSYGFIYTVVYREEQTKLVRMGFN